MADLESEVPDPRKVEYDLGYDEPRVVEPFKASRPRPKDHEAHKRARRRVSNESRKRNRRG